MNLRKLTTEGLKELAMEDLRMVVSSSLRATMAAHNVIGQLILINLKYSDGASKGFEDVASHLEIVSKHLKRATAAWAIVSERAAEERKAKRA